MTWNYVSIDDDDGEIKQNHKIELEKFSESNTPFPRDHAWTLFRRSMDRLKTVHLALPFTRSN